MPSKKQYNLVSDDAYDSRIPLHSEEAFQHGISFNAKYIGTLDVPRPNSRVEIVAAMRRIRYEFKAKAIKKKKVTITISVEGVKVSLRKKRKKKQWSWDDSRLTIMQHPVYRIFYVSHDSQDLKIFSYIARDGGSNVFKCNVFKSSKKSQAMRIVRTVGQAFEVCHKLSLAHATSIAGSQEEVVNAKEDLTLKDKLQKEMESKRCNSAEDDSCCQQQPEPLAPPPLSDRAASKSSTGASQTFSSPGNELLPATGTVLPEGTPLGIYHQVQLLREQLEQQIQYTQSTLAQLQLFKDQLAAESAARLETQSQNHQLMVHNKELLEHIRVLVHHIQDLEKKVHQLDGRNPPFLELPALRSMHPSNESVATCVPVPLPDFLQMEQATSTTTTGSSKLGSCTMQNAVAGSSPSGSPSPFSLPSSPTLMPNDLPRHGPLLSAPYSLDGSDSGPPPPRLHPPPHKFGSTALSDHDLFPGAADSTTAQMSLLLRQYSLPSSQLNNHSSASSAKSNPENFFSQALRDLKKLNLLEVNADATLFES